MTKKTKKTEGNGLCNAEPQTSKGQDFVKRMNEAMEGLSELGKRERIRVLNAIRLNLHKHSPFREQPVDCVLWVSADDVDANDYNPNKVAPPEMRLLERSIAEDGYTQPVVTWIEETRREVIDGFHRRRVGVESDSVRKMCGGYLPVTTANADRTDRSDRIAATIRHNRARGKHQVTAMSDIVVELKNRNWANDRIARELGMEQDEVLRLCQITGLSGLFSDQGFSRSWDVEGVVTESDFKEISDDISTYGEEADGFRVVNTSDENRIFHKYEKWECYKAGFYGTTVGGKTRGECEEMYVRLLSDTGRFSETLQHVIAEWIHSCEHYLTNVAMNRIAWLGQAALCYAEGIPSAFRGGYHLLTKEQQDAANEVALEYLNKWLSQNDRQLVSMDEAWANRQSDIY